MSWLDQVQAEREKLPPWLGNVLDHPRFSALHREGTEWFVYAGDGDTVQGPSLREACERFTERHG